MSMRKRTERKFTIGADRLTQASERVVDGATSLRDDVRGAFTSLRKVRPRPLRNRRARVIKKTVLRRLTPNLD